MSGEEKLTIQLLGPPRVLWQGEEWHIKRRKSRLLLYFLAYQPNKKVLSRSDIILYFWGDQPEDKGKSHLRDLLSKLRKELPQSDMLLANRELIWLNEEIVSVDAIDFDAIYRQLNLQILVPEDSPLSDMVFQKMIAAVNMWQAPQFMYGINALDEDDLQNWIDEQNNDLRYKRLDLMTKLGRHFVFLGDYKEANKWFDQVIQDDEFYNFDHAKVFRLEAVFRMGQLAQAASYCKELKENYLADDFGQYSHLFNDLCLDIEALGGDTPISTARLDDAGEHALLPFVGQQDLLNQIKAEYQNNGVIFISGEAGIGKTRLVHEALDKFFPPPRVFSFKGIAGESNIPFYPVLEYIRQAVKFDEWYKLDAYWVRELAHLLPELSKRFEGETIKLNFNAESEPAWAVFEAFRRLFLHLIAQKHFVFIIDDAQWVDAKSIQLFSFLIERDFFADNGALIFITRSGYPYSHLDAIRRNSRWRKKIHEINVPPLSYEEAGQIAQFIVRYPLPEGAVESLMRVSNGNPLYITETLHAILPLSLDLEKTENWRQLPLPVTVQNLILEQISQLSKDARCLLGEVSILGSDFDLNMVRLVSTLSEEELILALDELIEQQFLACESQRHQVNRYRFMKRFIQDVVLLDIGETKGQLYHLRVGRALLTLPKTALSIKLSTTMAQHLSEAGEKQDAFVAWLKTAKLAGRQNDWPQANHAFRKARSLSEIFSVPLSEQQYYDLYIRWADSALRFRDMTIANHCYQQAVIEGKRRGFYTLLGAGRRGQAHLYVLRNLPQAAEGLLENAEMLVKNRSKNELLQTRMVKGFMYLKSMQLREGMREFEQIFAMQTDQDEPDEGNNMLRAVFYGVRIYGMMGNLAQAVKLSESALEQCRDLDDTELKIIAHNTCGFIQFLSGHYEKAIFYYGSAVELAISISDWRLIFESWMMMSRVNLRMGSLFKAQELMSKAEQLIKTFQGKQLECMIRITQALSAIYLREYQAALNLLQEAKELNPNEFQKIQIAYYHGTALYGIGDQIEALDQLHEVSKIAEFGGYHHIEYLAKCQLLLINYLSGTPYSMIQDELEKLMQVGHQAGYGEVGGLQVYIQIMEDFKQGRINDAKEKAKALETIAARENVYWLYCGAADVFESVCVRSGNDEGKCQQQKQVYLHKMFAGLPSEMQKRAEEMQMAWIALN